MNEIYEISMLLDIYGQLLTPNQFECIDLHCNQDLSLGEIAEQLKISRQGVHDFVKRGKNLLNGYEAKLGLLERFERTKEELERVQAYLELIDEVGISKEDLHILTRAKQDLMETINKL